MTLNLALQFPLAESRFSLLWTLMLSHLYRMHIPSTIHSSLSLCTNTKQGHNIQRVCEQCTKLRIFFYNACQWKIQTFFFIKYYHSQLTAHIQYCKYETDKPTTMNTKLWNQHIIFSSYESTKFIGNRCKSILIQWYWNCFVCDTVRVCVCVFH